MNSSTKEVLDLLDQDESAYCSDMDDNFFADIINDNVLLLFYLSRELVLLVGIFFWIILMQLLTQKEKNVMISILGML